MMFLISTPSEWTPAARTPNDPEAEVSMPIEPSITQQKDEVPLEIPGILLHSCNIRTGQTWKDSPSAAFPAPRLRQTWRCSAHRSQKSLFFTVL
jgi:hypothetical protein